MKNTPVTPHQTKSAAVADLCFPAGQRLVLRINCGIDLLDPGWTYTDLAGQIWLTDRTISPGDQPGGWGSVGGGAVIRDVTLAGATSCPEVYQAERYDLKAYRLPLPAGRYTLRLHFAETYKAADPASQPAPRIFDVAIGDKTILKDFDVLKEAGGFAKPLVKEFRGVQVGATGLEIRFIANSNVPILNGLEVLGEEPLPQAFTLPLRDTSRYAARDGEVPVQPLPPAPGAVVCRVDCGAMLGEGYRYQAGTEEWLPDREWKEGAPYGAVGGAAGRRYGSIRYLGTTIPNVYRSERFNLKGYNFSVSPGTYTLRLHFAEGFESIFQPGFRVQDISIAGKTVLPAFDDMAASGGFARPVVMEVRGIEVKDGLLQIGFSQTKSDKDDHRGIGMCGPAICGIEVFRTGPEPQAVTQITKPRPAPDLGRPRPGLKTLKTLYIGNSHFFFWAIPETVAMMVNTGQSRFQLEPHRYLQGGKILKWFLDEDPARGAIQEIETGHYDMLVLLVLTGDAPDGFKTLARFAELAQKNGVGLMFHCQINSADNPKEVAQVRDLAKKYGAVFVPIGDVWKAGVDQAAMPMIWGAGDGVHTGIHRSYLTVCTHYLAWTGLSPVGHPHPYVVRTGARVDDASAAYLQKIALDTWQKLHAQPYVPATKP